MTMMIPRMISRPLVFGNQSSPPYLARAADYFKAQLIQRNIPATSLAISSGIQEGMAIIEIAVSDAALKAQVLSILKQLDGAIPMGDDRHVNFKVARVRLSVMSK